MVKICLADDHDIVRHGVKALLESNSNYKVVGEASTGLDIIPLLESTFPEVLIVDLMMPGLNGLDVVKQVAHKFPNIATIVLTMHEDEAYVLQALRNGAKGYVLKEATTKELPDAVHEALFGEIYLSKSLIERSIDPYSDAAQAKNSPTDAYESLTEREREIFKLTVDGHSSSEIGELLSISHRTVETHRNNLMRKLKIHSQKNLIRYALKRGLTV